MSLDNRLVRLYKNFSLLIVALLHFLQALVKPQLEALSSAPFVSTAKYTRVIFVCSSLVLLPLSFVTYLWMRFLPSTWLFAVSAFCLELIVKVVFSVAIFILFLIDASMDSVWEPLDDYIYWVRAIGGGIEFLFGVFLFCNGIWIMIYDQGGTIRAVMMGIHAYYNIWLQAHEGWTKFQKRRQSVVKINSMREATEEELERLEDVCCICYAEMTADVGARVTTCNHFFHGVCLRKWLYMQDNCPMCHRNVFEKTEADPEIS